MTSTEEMKCAPQENEEETVAMNVTDEQVAENNSEAKIDPHTALMQMPVNDQNSALNCLVGFVGVAQRRGAFALDEAAKAFHCVQMFVPASASAEAEAEASENQNTE